MSPAISCEEVCVRNTASLPVPPPTANLQTGSQTKGSTKRTKTGAVHPAGGALVNGGSGLAVDKPSLEKISFEPLNCSFGIVRTTEVDNKKAVGFKDIVHRQRETTGADVTIVFAVRTPGCAVCRENALHISDWASSLNASNVSRPKVSLVGIVKESGTPATDEAVLNFYENYFRCPLYIFRTRSRITGRQTPGRYGWSRGYTFRRSSRLHF
jgi:hypothetical protein